MEKDIRDEELAAMQAEGEEEVICVILTDEQGNEHEFYQDMVITVDDNNLQYSFRWKTAAARMMTAIATSMTKKKIPALSHAWTLTKTAKLFTPLRLTKNTKQLLLSMTKCLKTRSNSQPIILPDFGPVFFMRCDDVF